MHPGKSVLDTSFLGFLLDYCLRMWRSRECGAKKPAYKGVQQNEPDRSAIENSQGMMPNDAIPVHI